MTKRRFFEIIAGIFWAGLLLHGTAARAHSQEKRVNLAHLIHADSLVFQKQGNNNVLTFLGNVYFKKGAKSVTCDETVYYRQKEMAVFKGHVVMNDSGRVLRADEIVYYQNPEREMARGSVKFRNKGKRIQSGFLTYTDTQSRVLATQNVVFRDSVNAIELLADSLIYWVDKDYGEAKGHPKLFKRDSTGAVEIEIQAKKLAYNGNKSLAVALEKVKITKGDVVGFAAKAKYYNLEHKIVITGKPKVYQRGDKMKADTIEIFVKGKFLDRVHLIGRGRMSSIVHVDKKALEDWLSGQNIWLSFKKDTLQKVIVKDQAVSLYHVVENGKLKGENQVLGDWLKIQFKKGEVNHVMIKSTPGISRGKFYPPGAKITPVKP